MSAILDSLLLSAAYHSAGSNARDCYGIINLDFGWSFSIRERYLEGHSDKFHESNTKAVAKLKLNSTAANGIRRS